MNPRSQNPYVGPRAFQDGETLYGRDREVKKLLNLLIAERIVLLYSPSGAGKTSLVQAALIPELREEGFQVLPMIRVGLELPPNLELPATTNRYILSTLLSLEEGLPPEQQTPLTELVNMDLTTYLDRRLAEDDEVDGNVLIFDQFEEILTVDPTDQKAKAAFFAQLGKALRSRDRWTLFAMREEYPAGLDPYLRPVPTRLSTTFRLELLGAKAARQAMQEPARQAGVPFTNAAAEKLIDDLRRIRVQQPDGTTAERPGLYIEPVQLQVVCYRLWENLPDGATEIRETDIQEAGDVDSALAGYYADRVKATAETASVRERTIREWFDSQLITDQGIRGQVLRGPEQSQGLENTAIDPLVDAHLVRAENRRGATWYELAHDRLIKPVKEDNADWREKHLSPLQRQAALWESQSRSGGLLLHGEALEKAERWAIEHQDELLFTEKEFLAASRKARTIIEREKRQTRRIRRWAIGATIMTTITMITGGVALFFFLTLRQETERLRIVSITQSLAAQAQSTNQVELGALLARQAYLFNQRNQSNMLNQIDIALRTVLGASYFFSPILYYPEEVVSVALSPDGQFFASGSSNGIIKLWNLNKLNSGPVVLGRHKGTVWSVAFSPNGQIIASGGGDKTVRLWDLQDPSGAPTILPGHKGIVFSVTFSPNGQILASGSLDGTVRLWDLQNLRADPHVLRGPKRSVNSVAFSPDGQMLVSGSSDKTLRLWNLQHPITEPIILYEPGGEITSVAFSPNGQILALGTTWDATVRLWNLTDLTAWSTVLYGHDDMVTSVAFSPDGQTLASGSWDRTVRLWNLQDSKSEPVILRGHKDPIFSLAFSSDGQTLVSGSKDRTVRFWNLSKSGSTTVVLRGHKSEVKSVVFNKDNQALLSVSDDGSVRLWDITKQSSILTLLPKRSFKINAVGFSPNGQTMALGCDDGTVRLADLRNVSDSNKLLDNFTVLRGHTGSVRSVIFSPDGQTLASGSEDRTIRIWTLQNLGTNSTVLDSHTGPVFSLAFSPDGKTLASGSGRSIFESGPDNEILLWDLHKPVHAPMLVSWLSHEDKEQEGHKGPVFSLAFSSDGKILASGSGDKTVRLCWMDRYTSNEILVGHGGQIFSLAFSSDGEFLASGGEDQTIRLWNLHNLKVNPIVLHGHKNPVSSLAFSPDGKLLASGSQGGAIFIWPHTETLADEVCQKVSRNLTQEEWLQFVGKDIPYELTCPELPEGERVLSYAQ